MFKGIMLVSWSGKDGQINFIKPGALVGGIVWAFTSTLFICAALMLWVFMTAGQVYHFSSIITAGIFLGAFLGGVVSGRTAGSMGWMHGTLSGLLYYMIMVLIFSFWSAAVITLPIIFMRLLVVLGLATLGGVIGVNLPEKRDGINHYKRQL